MRDAAAAGLGVVSGSLRLSAAVGSAADVCGAGVGVGVDVDVDVDAGIGVGVYSAKHSELCTMACIASAGRGLAQYIHFWAKAEVRAGREISEGSVEMRKPSRVQVWWGGGVGVVDI